MKQHLHKQLSRVAAALFLTMCMYTLQAQDPTFSQFDGNQLYFNPAYTGYKKAARIGASYRNLWPNVPGKRLPGPLGSYSFQGDAYFDIKSKFAGGVGAFVMQDVEGEGYLTTTTAGIMYSQHIGNLRARNDEQERWGLFFGVKAYMGQVKIDWDRLVFSDQLDVNHGVYNPTSYNQTGTVVKFYPDFDWGLVVRNNFRAKGKWFNELGFSMSHTLQPTIALSGLSGSEATRLPRKYMASYRSNIAIKQNFFLGPTILFENQANFYAFNAGVDFFLRFNKKRDIMPFSIGIYNRFSWQLKNTQTNEGKINTSAIIVALNHRGYFASGKYAVGYYAGFSVDFPYLGLAMQTAGAYELTAGVIIPYKKKQVLKCPFEAY